jgi:hypothetical protein
MKAISTAQVEDDGEKEMMHQQMQEMLRRQQEMEREYQLMQEETIKLQLQKAEIEEKAKKERDESHRHQMKMEEEKRATDRFRQQIKEVERKIIEANECVKFMRKNVKFSYQLVSVMPETFRLDSTQSDSFQAASTVNK